MVVSCSEDGADMSVLVAPGNLRSALAVTRSLGRLGVHERTSNSLTSTHSPGVLAFEITRGALQDPLVAIKGEVS